MCVYCDKLYSGNSSENLSHAKINANGVMVALMVSYIGENDELQPTLRTVLMDNHGENIAAEEIYISWCPVCGRKLKQES